MSLGHVISAQLCDAPMTRPDGTDALIAEARGGRLLPGDGELPLLNLLKALPEHTVLSVELPSVSDKRPPLDRARAIRAATSTLLQQMSP
jgi:sugar phosphate isomerase/epimerase